MHIDINTRLRRLLLPIVSITVCASLSACGGGSGNDANPGGPTTTTAFTVTPSVLDFGKTVTGATVEGALLITNTGTASFATEVLGLADGFTLMNSCDTLQPSQECSLLFEFSPTEERNYSSAVTLAANSRQQSVTLQGNGQGLNIEIISAELNCQASSINANVAVTDANGEATLGLGDGNVTVFLNGSEVNLLSGIQTITDRQTLAVGILLDWSQSLADYQPSLIDATTIFIESLGFSENGQIDRAAVFKFGRSLDRPFRDGFVDVDDDGKQILIGHLYEDINVDNRASGIWNSMIEVADKVEIQPLNSKSIILLSDGRNNNGDVTLDNLIASLASRGIGVFTIGFGDLDPGPLQRLSEETGGLFYADASAQTLSQAFERISSALTNQYVLAIENSSPGSTNELRISFMNDAGRAGDDTVTIASCP